MKKILGLLLMLVLICQTLVAGEEFQVEVYHSESATYLHFLSSGFGDSFVSRSMQDLIKKHDFKKFDFKSHKVSYKKFKSYLLNGYNFKTVKTRPKGFYGNDAFIALSATHPSLEDFENNLSILLPYEALVEYYSIKKALYPKFKKTIWEPSLNNQSKEINSIQKAMKESGFSKKLSNVKAFYNSKYPSQLPMKIALIPIDDRGFKKKHTSAQSLKDIQVVPYLMSVGAKDSLDVIFHELAHALYEGQSQKTKKEIEDYFMNSKHSHATFTYTYLNEIMATALGNGWYAESIKPSFLKKSWYSVSYINDIAKEIYPAVKKYADDSKPIDESFFQTVLKASEKKFPNAPFELEPNLLALQVLSEHSNLDRKEVARSLRKSFRIQSMRWSFPMRSKDWNRITGLGKHTSFLITKDLKNTQVKLKDHLPKNYLSLIKNKEKFLASFKVKGRYVLWLNTASPEKDIPRVINKLESTSLLKKDFSVIEL